MRFLSWLRIPLLFSGLFTLSWLCAQTSSGAALVAHHRSAYTIVLPASARAPLQRAAQELQRCIAEATGVQLPIVTDNTAVSGPVISLGATRLARTAGFSETGLEDESSRFVTRGGNLFIFGPDTPEGGWTTRGGTSTGTANGVYSFLENYLGVRWLMPGDLGRDVPKRDDFILPTLDRVETTPFGWRQVPYIQDGLDLATVHDWEEHQKLRYYAVDLVYSHNWESVVPAKMFKDHPDWFAMIGGVRHEPGYSRSANETSYKLETTNPELVDFYAAKAVEAMRASKRPRTFSLSPTDGRGWSESPESKALYDPPVSVPIAPEAEWGGNRPQMSSLVFKFYNDVSLAVAKQYPQGRLAGYLYADYIFPPTKIAARLPDNFTPVIAAGNSGFRLYRKDSQAAFRQLMDGWARVAPKDWYFYNFPNIVLTGADGSNYESVGSTGLVEPAAPEILNVIFDTLRRDHIRGARIYGAFSWSSSALTNYLLAQMLWKPDRDAAALQAEWLHRAYGDAAGTAMEKFYAKLDDTYASYLDQHANKRTYRLHEDMMKGLYAPNYAAYEDLLLAAKREPMTTVQRQRLQLIEDNLSVLQWRLRNLGFLSADVGAKLPADDAHVLDLLNQPTGDFQLFPQFLFEGPGQLPYTPAVTSVKLAAEVAGATAKGEDKLPWDMNGILLYATQDGPVSFTPTAVRQGIYFAGYIVVTLDRAKHVMAVGAMGPGRTVTFQAKRDTAYYLYLPPRDKKMSYTLSFPGAVVASGSRRGESIALRGERGPLYVYHPTADKEVQLTMADANGRPTVTVTKP